MKKQMLTNQKENKGITLIALVITIIVLLILAAVSIATLTGENGILTQASTAKEKTEIEEAKEQAKLDIAEWTAAKLQKGEDATLSDSIVKGILTGKDYVKGEPGESSFLTKHGSYEINFSDLYSLNQTEEQTINFSVSCIPLESLHDLVPVHVLEASVPIGATWFDFLSEGRLEILRVL